MIHYQLSKDESKRVRHGNIINQITTINNQLSLSLPTVQGQVQEGWTLPVGELPSLFPLLQTSFDSPGREAVIQQLECSYNKHQNQGQFHDNSLI